MATTHDARRRQRTTHRTTSAHARSVVLDRKDRKAPAATAPSMDDIEAIEKAPVKAVKPIRTADSDDHLAAYFRQLAEHELLTPEDERELSQGIEDTEILTWERVLGRPEVIVHL